MRYLLTVDPGIRVAGVALFGAGQLIGATCIRGAKAGNGAAQCAYMAREIETWAHIKLAQRGDASSTEYVCEWPQIYTRDKSKCDPNDLIALAGIGAAVCALLPGIPATSYKPADWKKQVDGDVMIGRILATIEPDELKIIAMSCLKIDPVTHADRIVELINNSIAHNAIDAVGIGLYHLGRLERKRVFAR